MARRDQRSPEAEQYRRLYKTARWTSTRKRQLSAHPMCKPCLARGRITPATVCHHKDKASKANPATFYDGPFESLCAPCHDSDAQSQERRGYSNEIGLDGWPTDENHPFNVEAKALK